MDGWHGHKVWLPFLVTASVWLFVIFVTASLVSKTWADLIGLFYLMASPFIYRFVKTLVAEREPRVEPNRDRTEAGPANQ